MCLCFTQDNTAELCMMNSSADASCRRFILGMEMVMRPQGPHYRIRKVAVPFGIFSNRLIQGQVKCTLCVPPKPIALIGINNKTSMIHYLLRKYKQEYIVDIRTGKKVSFLILSFNSFQFKLNMLCFCNRTGGM
jgi:hypothetical protein